MDIKKQYDIWIDYMVTQIYLKHWKNLDKQPFKDLQAKTFDEFIIVTDSRLHDNIHGWYERFKKRIDK